MPVMGLHNPKRQKVQEHNTNNGPLPPQQTEGTETECRIRCTLVNGPLPPEQTVPRRNRQVLPPNRNRRYQQKQTELSVP